MSHCPFCKKKIAMSKAFCTRNCKENYFQLIAIQIPKLILKRIYVFCSKEEREKEIVDFATRHISHRIQLRYLGHWKQRVNTIICKSLRPTFKIQQLNEKNKVENIYYSKTFTFNK